MDIGSKIQEIVTKIQNNKDFAAEFSANPAKAIETIVGVDLPDDQVNAVIEGVKSKLSVDQAGGILGSIKKLF